MSSFINTSVAPQRSGLSQVLIHQSSGPSWTPRVYYRGRSLKCFCHIYRQRQRFRGNMISCGVMDRTFLWRSCRLFILSRATREKTVKSLSAVSRLTHICLQPQFSISLFLIHKSFFLTFFFNFLKKKMALVVCTRRKQLHTLLIRCNHSRPTNIHNTDEDFNSSTMFLSRFLLRLHHQLRLNAEGFKKWSNINSSDLIFLWKHVGVGN